MKDIQLVPNIIHFIFGMAHDFGGRPFSFIHYINIKSAIEVNDPEQFNVYYHYEPTGEWWEKATKLPKVKVIKVDLPVSPDGRDLKHYAHRAGVLRLNVLIENGGIYLDSDVFCIRPFTPFLYEACTLGYQGDGRVCDAVIMATKGSSFLEYWVDFYRDFYPQREHDSVWDTLACVTPTNLQKTYPHLVTFVNDSNFHHPNWCSYQTLFKITDINPFPDSYCYHLWESCSWSCLSNLTPQTLNKDLYLHKLIQKHL